MEIKNLTGLKFIPCHRLHERSPVIFGKHFPLCYRCSFMILGYLFVPVLFLMNFSISFVWGILLNIPMLVDGFTQYKKIRKSNNCLRAVTGILSGLGQSIVIVYFANLLVSILLKLSH